MANEGPGNCILPGTPGNDLTFKIRTFITLLNFAPPLRPLCWQPR
jgi:hypothetical protein